MLDDFDGQFSDDMSKLSKLKKKVVSVEAAVMKLLLVPGRCDGVNVELRAHVNVNV